MLTMMPVVLDSPQWLWLLLAAAPTGLLLRRRSAAWFASIGVALLAIAAAGPAWHRPVPPRVALMIDLSPSTRSAFWRDEAEVERLRDALQDRAEVELFLVAGQTVPHESGATFPNELIAPEMRLRVPASVDAAVILTDGQLAEADATAPLLFLVDPALDVPGDEAVTRLALDAGDVVIQATGEVALNDDQTPLVADGAAAAADAGSGTQEPAAEDPKSHPQRQGNSLIRVPAASEAFTARIADPVDRWPENDHLTLPPALDRIGRRIALGLTIDGFETIEPRILADAASLADATVLVLDPAAAETLPNQAATVQLFVRDYGGLLVLTGTASPGPLARVSPLSLVPPEPRADWVLLVDASGSMAGPAGEGKRSRFEVATTALLSAAAALPAETRVDVGDFSSDLQWWTRGTPAGRITAAIIPPAARPGGETNLAVALEQVAADALPDRPTQVLLLSDAEATVPPELADLLSAASVTVNLLAIGDRVDDSVEDLITRTGGRFAQEVNPSQWRSAAQSLARSVAGGRVSSAPTALRWQADLAHLDQTDAAPWRPAWIKESAQILAESEDGAAVAIWRVGGGRVIAASAELDGQTVSAIADAFAGEADEAVTVEWSDGESLAVEVVAPGASQVELRRDGSVVQATQVGPDHWRAHLIGERQPAVATVLVDGRVAERRATAGRYAPEFEHLGNDHARMLALAEATAGNVAARLEDLPLPVRRERINLTAVVSLAGAVLVGAAVASLTRRGLAMGR